MNTSSANKPLIGTNNNRQVRPSSLPKGRTIPKPSAAATNSNVSSTINNGRKPRPSSASVSRGGSKPNTNTTTINASSEKKSRPLSAAAVKEGPVTRTSFETGSQVKEELKEKAKLSIRNQRLTERYYLTSLQLLKRVNAGACKDNKERKVAMDRLKLMENLHLQSIETTDLSLLASEENLKKMHKNKYPNIQPKIYEASKYYGAGGDKEREREERERLNQTAKAEQTETEKPKRTLRGRAPQSNTTTSAPSSSSEENKLSTQEEDRSEQVQNERDDTDDSDSDTDTDNDSDNSTPEKTKVHSRPPTQTSSTLYRPPAASTSSNQDDKPKRTLRGGRRPTQSEETQTESTSPTENTPTTERTNQTATE